MLLVADDDIDKMFVYSQQYELSCYDKDMSLTNEHHHLLFYLL